MLANETATLAEVAQALGRSESWLRRNWLRIHVEDGFPRKLPTGPVWPRQLVEAWCRSGGFAPPPAPASANDNLLSDPKAAYRASLSQRYGVEA